MKAFLALVALYATAWLFMEGPFINGLALRPITVSTGEVAKLHEFSFVQGGVVSVSLSDVAISIRGGEGLQTALDVALMLVPRSLLSLAPASACFHSGFTARELVPSTLRYLSSWELVGGQDIVATWEASQDLSMAVVVSNCTPDSRMVFFSAVSAYNVVNGTRRYLSSGEDLQPALYFTLAALIFLFFVALLRQMWGAPNISALGPMFAATVLLQSLGTALRGLGYLAQLRNRSAEVFFFLAAVFTAFILLAIVTAVLAYLWTLRREVTKSSLVLLYLLFASLLMAGSSASSHAGNIVVFFKDVSLSHGRVMLLLGALCCAAFALVLKVEAPAADQPAKAFSHFYSHSSLFCCLYVTFFFVIRMVLYVSISGDARTMTWTVNFSRELATLLWFFGASQPVMNAATRKDYLPLS